MAGFDQKPWGGKTQDPLHDNCVPTPSKFYNHCRQLRAVHDQYQQTTGGIHPRSHLRPLYRSLSTA
jgi:hypothetical protein